MDLGSVTSVTASGRGYEPSKRQNSNEGQDLISNLPDFIIGHILSFLSTKDAVRTGVLSERWRYMWTFVTELSFKDRERFSSNKIRKTCFIHFVYRVLVHLNSTNIDSCSLSISEIYDSSHVNEWISIVLNLRIKKLCVYSLREIPFSSHSLFKCNSLRELVLDGCPIRFPTFVCLSSLTVLKLSGITVTCSPSNELKTLTLNFPVLRKYETEKCTWSGVKSVTLQVPLLKVLSMDYGKFVKSNAEFKFCVSHLAQFCYIGRILSEAILLDAHIASANITLYDSKKSVQETRLFVSRLLSINTECLKLYLRTQKVLARVKHSFPDIPALEMLGHLDLAFVTGEFLLGLLFKSPSLQTLVLKVQDFGEELANSTILPACFLFTLKVVKFERFFGNKHELCFAKYVLENALVLERITFSCCQGLRSLNKWEKVKEKLSSYKSSFSSVSIEFLC